MPPTPCRHHRRAASFVTAALAALLVSCSGGPGAFEPAQPAPVLERHGRLRQLLRRAFPAHYRDGMALFWKPGDALRPERLGRVDPGRVFAYFRDAAAPAFHSPHVVTRCAVVGSSGNLLRARQGEEIDAHDVVLRINLAPTRGFEADVGRRTTHYLVSQFFLRRVLGVSGEPADDPDRDARLGSVDASAFWLLLFRPWDDKNAMEEMITQLGILERSSHRVPRERSRLVHPEFAIHVEDWSQYHTDPSTGLIGVMMAVHACDAVDVYGFGADSRGERRYYYKPGTFSAHGPDVEEALLHRLDAAGVIRRRPGS